jgi:hypothetical protein
MKTKIIGAVILVVIVIAAVFFQSHPLNKPVITLKGFVGGEKTGLLDDPEFQKLLKTKYGIELDYSKAGSIEMVQGDTGKSDFLFPSSQTALEIFKTTKGQQLIKSENIFNSPLVFYSWDSVTEALIKAGLVQKKDSVYLVDLPKLVDLILKNKKWSDIGLNDLYGNITVISTDPTKSNSGNMFAGLLANTLNGDIVDQKTVENVLPKLTQFFSKLGYLENSSADLFEQYLRTGVGAKPIIVGYENQIIEFSHMNQGSWQNIKDRIRILYPVPTVWSAHPLIALTPQSNELIKALQDKEVQKMAWETHGFRTGLLGVQDDQSVLKVVGILPTVNKVVSLPSPEVMERIITALQKK